MSNPLPSRLSSIAAAPLLGLVWAYRFTLGPFLGGRCRFYPSCSQYALDAIHTHGPFRGTYLTLRRLAKCHPLGPHGFDPVPPRHDPNDPSMNPPRSPDHPQAPRGLSA